MAGLDTATGSPVKLFVHDGQITGFLFNDNGVWTTCFGQDLFSEGLSFKSIKIKGDYRIIDVIYYTDKTLLAYRGFGVPLEHTRVYILRGGDLDFTPQNPFINYAPLNAMEEDIVIRSQGVI